MITAVLSACLLAYPGQVTSGELIHKSAQMRVGEGAPREHRLTSEVAIDCNNNGIPDPEDVRSGLDTDNDSDGVPDHCGKLIDWKWSVDHKSLGPESVTDEDKYFRIAYLPTKAIEIVYAVPKRENVELLIVVGPGAIKVLTEGIREPGVYKVDFNPTAADGSPMMKGLAFFREKLGGSTYTRPLAWRW